MAKDNKSAEAKAKKPGNTYVTTEFRHKDNFNQVHEVGDDISDEDPERIAYLIGLGLAETLAEPAKEEPRK